MATTTAMAGRRIKARRTYAGLSQTDLARIIVSQTGKSSVDVWQQRISKYEHARHSPGPRVMAIIEAALGQHRKQETAASAGMRRLARDLSVLLTRVSVVIEACDSEELGFIADDLESLATMVRKMVVTPR